MPSLRRAFVWVVLLTLVGTTSAAPPGDGRQAASGGSPGLLSFVSFLWEWEHDKIIRVDTNAFARDARNGTVGLELRKDVVLETYEVDGWAEGSAPSEAWAFRGAVRGEPDSEVTLYVSSTGLYGVVRIRSTSYELNPVDDKPPPAGELETVRVTWPVFSWI